MCMFMCVYIFKSTPILKEPFSTKLLLNLRISTKSNARIRNWHFVNCVDEAEFSPSPFLLL